MAAGMTAALAGVVLPNRAFASVVRVPLRPDTRHTTPEMWLPDGLPSEILREYAAVAMEAAKSAGADFADIRLGVQRGLWVVHNPGGSVEIALQVGYGVRAWVNGTWSFQHGNVFSKDAIATAARSAVLGARTYAAVNRALPRGTTPGLPSEWASEPPVTGEWHVPVQIDPFRVPIDDHHRALEVLTDNIAARTYKSIELSSFQVGWAGETRVFASSAGSMVTQHTMKGLVHTWGGVESWRHEIKVGTEPLGFSEPSLHPGGFELVLAPDLVANRMAQIDDALLLSELPVRSFSDMGRFPMVFDGSSMANIIGNTINVALDGDRVFGLEADASGTSFLSPADEILGASKPQFSPLLSMKADRVLPSPLAVQWDDDGVVPESYSLVEQGRVVDFHTTRETAPMMAEWYAKRGLPLRSHGCSMAKTPASMPVCGGADVHVTPSSTTATIKDLMREVKHGFMIGGVHVDVDPGLSGGTLDGRWAYRVLEIKNGVPVAHSMVTMQFVTQALLNKNLVAIGDASTVRPVIASTAKGIPWESVDQRVHAPAALCKDVDVVLRG